LEAASANAFQALEVSDKLLLREGMAAFFAKLLGGFGNDEWFRRGVGHGDLRCL